MFILYPFMYIVSLAITIFSWLFNPIIVLFADNDGNLPKYLYYFQTFDAPIPKGYLAGLTWLNRNPSYGFDLFVFGIKWEPEKWKIRKIFSNENYELFFATSSNGAFSFKYHNLKRDSYTKYGWKAFNFYDFQKGDFSRQWNGTRGLVPIC